jgi:hypothetical protein
MEIFVIVGLCVFFIFPNVYADKDKPEGKEIIEKYCSEFMEIMKMVDVNSTVI